MRKMLSLALHQCGLVFTKMQQKITGFLKRSQLQYTAPIPQFNAKMHQNRAMLFQFHAGLQQFYCQICAGPLK